MNDEEFIRRIQNLMRVDKTEGKSLQFAKDYLRCHGHYTVKDIPEPRREFFLTYLKLVAGY